MNDITFGIATGMALTGMVATVCTALLGFWKVAFVSLCIMVFGLYVIAKDGRDEPEEITQ